MEHHADFAVPVTHRLWVETSVERPDGLGTFAGWVISLGWWVDPGQTDPGEATGTLYLVVDDRGGPPVWIAQGNITRCRIELDS